ncbi:hypothetical protein [Halegenticoccus tardaugens]|uniref:hypothetical protein n=1 Tax=Halegenticoccus tardaugens TaxID=2071624 RepID=UPI0013E9003E|nr:hypothetical protein [Halegenticoccus tardaugens]
MLAREWTLACRYRTPEDYEIPAVPVWGVWCDENGRLSFSARGSSEPFISAGQPVPVRR